MAPLAALVVTLAVRAFASHAPALAVLGTANLPVLDVAAFALLLLRAGVAIEPRTLRAIAPAAVFLGLVPAAIEVGTVAVLCHELLFSSWALCFLGGFLVAAVSPAIVLPAVTARERFGGHARRPVPDLILGQTLVNTMIALAGVLVVLMRVAGVMTWAPAILGCLAAIAAVLATLGFGVLLRRRLDAAGRRGREHVESLAEGILLVGLGWSVPLRALANGPLLLEALFILSAALLGRLLSATYSAGATSLSREERRYVVFAQFPKSTMQAVLAPLALLALRATRPELAHEGEMLMVLAVVCVLATAVPGELMLDRFAPRAWFDDTGTPRPAVRPAPVPMPGPEPSAPRPPAPRSTAPKKVDQR